MKILVLGTGLQGKAALHDLAYSPAVTQVIAADANIEDLTRFISTLAVCRRSLMLQRRIDVNFRYEQKIQNR
jgi:saccharopine dehydrogenase-like NADP-dependent oxidoreductase